MQCIKYRRKVLTEKKIIDLLRTKINEISKKFRVDVLNMECDKDHFHLLFKAKPTLDMPKYLNAIKTISSREIRRNSPKIKKKLWEDTFWSRSYFLATTGQVTLDQLKKYVESQNATNSTNKN